ncbi:MAG: hypothetical protein M0Z29_09390, partial [Actinomycetota bacterium]|nr:hypothetical protein [Actinomycetota bacterium]
MSVKDELRSGSGSVSGGGGDAPANRTDPGLPRRKRRKGRWHTSIGALPFLVYVALFLLVPAISVVATAFKNGNGQFTMANFDEAASGVYLQSFIASIKLSFASALIASIVGVMAAIDATTT